MHSSRQHNHGTASRTNRVSTPSSVNFATLPPTAQKIGPQRPPGFRHQEVLLQNALVQQTPLHATPTRHRCRRKERRVNLTPSESCKTSTEEKDMHMRNRYEKHCTTKWRLHSNCIATRSILNSEHKDLQCRCMCHSSSPLRLMNVNNHHHSGLITVSSWMAIAPLFRSA